VDRRRDSDQWFLDFWASYPRKVNRAAAKKAWDKLRPDAATVKAIAEALVWQREQWDDPKFIPHASTYLNNERWTDEPPEVKPQKQMGRAAANVFRVLGGKAS
jgi:hypothetical protein